MQGRLPQGIAARKLPCQLLPLPEKALRNLRRRDGTEVEVILPRRRPTPRFGLRQMIEKIVHAISMAQLGPEQKGNWRTRQDSNL